MNKNIIYILFLGLIGLFSACSTEEPTPSTEVSAATLAKITAYGTSKALTFTKTPESVFYAISTKNATGRVPLNNEYVKLNYTFVKLDGTILDSSAVNRKIPYSFLYNTTSTSLLTYGVSLMKEGETATFVFPTTTTSTEPVAMKLTLLSTRNETEQIDEYVKEKFPSFTLKKTISGMQYLITKISGSGDTVKTGKTATIAFTGRFLFQFRTTDSNGFPIYTDKFDGGSFSFLVGATGAIAGFQEAAKLMKVGDKGTFIFSSSLGYGTRGSDDGKIPGFTPLLFDMEVTAVK